MRSDRWLHVMTALLVLALPAAGEFKLDEGNLFRALWYDAPLVVGDGFADMAPMGEADGMDVAALDDGKAVNVYTNTSDMLDFRREAALRDAGGAIELTLRARLYPYHGLRAPVYYEFAVPCQVLDGYAFRAVTGRPYKQEFAKGALSKDAADGTIVSSLVFMNLAKEDKALSLDFAPRGRGLYYNVRNKGMVGNAWTLLKRGNLFVFRTGMRNDWYGGMLTTKVVIHDAALDYDAIHPAPDKWHYGLSPQTMLAATAQEPRPEGYVALGAQEYEEGTAIGWAVSEGLQRKPALLGGVISGKSGTLKISVPPGKYLVSSSHASPSVDVALEGDDLDIALVKLLQEPTALTWGTFPMTVKDKPVTLVFKSPFSLGSVVMQRLLTPYEMRYTLVENDAIWAVNEGIPTPDKEIDPGRPLTGELDAMTDEEEWRWNMAMTSFGPSNTGSRNELVTYEDIDTRIQEVVAAGYNTVINNGLHFRYCHPNEMTMMQENAKRLCEVAHRRGVRVIEHHDVPILQAQNEGFQTLLRHPDWLQRNLATGAVASMFCVNNPDFRENYYEWFRQYAEDTGIDGCMLDEVTFFGPEYCGCRHCRAAFTQETGLALPLKDENNVFFNKDNPLWVAWEQWRVRSTAGFFKEIRAILDEIRPGAAMMTYTTHYGFTSSYGSRNYGSDLVARAKYCDLLGTEIMSRNVLASYRSVYGFRKTKAALGLRYNSPIYGLVYHQNDPTVAYIGWALLQMTRQTSWITTIEGYDIGELFNWKDRMNPRGAAPMSDVAIVFSRNCCNYNRASSHAAAAMGWSQQLTDAHIQHDVILDDGLTAETLANYRLIILAAAECMSDEDADLYAAYAEGGGNLLVTGRTGFNDHLGAPRETPALAGVCGVRFEEGASREGAILREGLEEPAQLKGATLAFQPLPGSQVLASVAGEDGSAGPAAACRRSVGEGTATYAGCSLGAENYMREYTVGQTFSFALNAPARALAWELARGALGKQPLRFEAVRMPEGVLASAYETQEGAAVHLLNGTGLTMEPGTAVPRGSSAFSFPALEEDVVFDIRMPSLKEGRIVSPDFQGARPLRVERWSGFYRVRAPKESLGRYSVVYLDN